MKPVFDNEEWQVNFPSLEKSTFVIEENTVDGSFKSQEKHKASPVYTESETILRELFAGAKEKTLREENLIVSIFQVAEGSKVLIASWEKGKMFEYQCPTWRNQVFF